MSASHSNMILIGMPGSGKSTVGVILAKLISFDFIDTDILIQKSKGRPLQKIVDREGPMVLRQIEAGVLLDLKCTRSVISTGGSAVYSEAAMAHLKTLGTIVYLKVDLDVLASRIHDFFTRGLARRPGQSLSDLFAERAPLYAKHADMTIDCTNLTQEAVCRSIILQAGF